MAGEGEAIAPRPPSYGYRPSLPWLRYWLQDFFKKAELIEQAQ